MGLRNLKSKAKRLARGRKNEIDKGLDKAERTVSAKTGGKYDERMRSVRRKADNALGNDNPKPPPLSTDPTRLRHLGMARPPGNRALSHISTGRAM